jgi:hypothetical protein
MRSFLSIALLSIWLAPGPGVEAGPAVPIGFVPDPSCRSSKLVVPLERALAAAFSAEGYAPVKESPEKARLVLQYYLTSLPQDDGQRVVQVDAQVLGARGGKVLASGSARSESFPGDEAGQQRAAEQAGARLAEQFISPLAAALQETGRGRRVLLQITLVGDEARAARAQVLERVKKTLGSQLAQVQSSSDSNLMLVLKTDRPPRQLADELSRALQGLSDLAPTWMVRAQASMLLELSRKAP